MDINKELDRIQKAGVSVTLRWNRSVRFIGGTIKRGNGWSINLSCIRREDETFDQTIYRAILAFDEKHPEYL